jgi:zinc protease
MRHVAQRILLIITLGVLAMLTPARAEDWRDIPVPTRPDLVEGRLANGLRYIVLPHATPPGQVRLALRIEVGSLHEDENERGVAHFVEHLAFSGSANFPPGQAVRFFESHGLTFGRHQNAYTAFDSTVYTMALPDADHELINDAMIFLSDVADRVLFLPEEIESERAVMINELTARTSARQRAWEATIEGLFPDSRFGRRLPGGDDAVIRTIDRDQIISFYERWYVPNNMTLMAVGDADPNLIVKLINEHFGSISSSPLLMSVDMAIPASEQPRGLVVADPELTEAGVELVRIAAPDAPVLTVGQVRRELVETLGPIVFQRRMQTRIEEGDASCREVKAGLQQLYRSAKLSVVGVEGDPASSAAMLEELTLELSRARRYGFTKREVEDARRSVLAKLEREADGEATISARRLIRQINLAVEQGTPVTAPSQILPIMRKLLPNIGAREVSDAFARNYDPAHLVYIITGPDDPDAPLPRAEDLPAIAAKLFKQPLDPPKASTTPDRLMTETPVPGEIESIAMHEPTGVLTARFANGVVAHYRYSDARKHAVVLALTFGGGALEETPETKGLTDAAFSIWDRPATSTLSATDIRNLLIGRKLEHYAYYTRDAITFEITTHPDDLDVAGQLGHLMLADPVIEPAVFEQWRSDRLEQIRKRKLDVEGSVVEHLRHVLYHETHPERTLLEAADIERITLANAQAWLDRMVETAPIEVVVVGDVPQDEALGMLRRYVGSLPARPTPSPELFAEARQLTLSPPPYEAVVEIETMTEKAVVFRGFLAADASNTRDRRLLDLAVQILDSRALVRMREQEQLIYAVKFANEPAEVFPGLGVVFAMAPCHPSVADRISEIFDEMFRELAEQGPSGAEVEVARDQILNRLSESMGQPSLWTWWLRDAALHGESFDDFVDVQKAYDAFTADDVRTVMQTYYGKRPHLHIITRPATRPAGADADAAAETTSR